MNKHETIKTYRLLAENAKEKNQLIKALEFPENTLDAIIESGLASGELEVSDTYYSLTEKGQDFLSAYKVDNAIILAAGFGSRCVPLTYETPKGLLCVHGKPMIERQIEQLLEKGITEIIIVVGYMKERFDYLIDKYGVKLVFNAEYSTKNNLASLYCVKEYLKGSYVLVADNWIVNNIFNTYEPYSWFSCPYMQGDTAEWCVTEADDDGLIKKIEVGGCDRWAIVGPAYFNRDFSKTFSSYLEAYYKKPESADYYWEHILKDEIEALPMYINKQIDNVYEFESLEELRQYDKSYINDTKNKIMHYISEVFDVEQGEICEILPLKDGVTNMSFLFSVKGNKYVFRLPGIGTDKLIDRKNEKKVYELISALNIADEVVSFDADSGVKISKYYENSRIADPFCDEDLKTSMEQMRKVHEQKFKVDHSFDIENMISYYYSLADEINAILFTDIEDVLKKVKRLIRFRDELAISEILCHGDYAHTNILILPNKESKLIDWEYSGTSDPIMDVSMYTIYAEFPKERIDLALRMYFGREPTKMEWARLYLYVALGGFLWCIWGEYKQGMGQEFGDYPLKMYRYMKDFYKILEQDGLLTD